ncbi:zinc ribbon domain-containing protein [Nocardioides ferulae]|uniref:zinc ribbon domain-containing protein n=1 Tax=Nocardioides ferulae TaxID=2340821 RepID=UPI000EB52398|nr:zinc ribbon domain-containing protein [Nocardioides ferulae]
MTHAPGFARQGQYRTALRVGGAVLLLAGILTFVWGVAGVFGAEFEPEGRRIVAFIGGLPIIGFGAMLLQWGFLGAGARYAAGETMPVVKDSAAYLTDGQGLAGIGRTADDLSADVAATGPFCRQCGVRNDADARFCDSCGSSLG